MFWEESKGLKNVAKSSKIAITAFLILAGISHLFGFLNIYFTYSPIDEQKGLSIKDIQYSFYGKREGTLLEKSIVGSMKEYFADDNEYNTIKQWIQEGAKEENFPPVKEVFENSCIMCHSKDDPSAGVSLESFEDVQKTLKQDTGKPVSRLISLSHTHLFGIITTLFILAFIFSFIKFSQGLKSFVFSLAFFAAAFDIGSWWLAKLGPALAGFVLLAGILVALSFALLILLPLYEMWIKEMWIKKE